MQTVTIADIEIQFRRHTEICNNAGLIPKGYELVLDHGQPSAGIAWRMALTGKRAADGTYPNGSGHGRPPLGTDPLGYLGSTKREAFEKLATINATATDFTYALKLGDVIEVSTADHAIELHYAHLVDRDQAYRNLERGTTHRMSY